MRNKMLVIAVLALALTLTSVAFVSAQGEAGPVTQAILDRGELICGVNNQLTGFGEVNEAGEFVGFDVDICRAVAAAVVGDANAVQYRALTAAERPTALASGEIDMLSRNTTWTLSRDTEWGAIFGPTTFYDGQGIMVFAETGIATLEDLEGGIICTNAGTTTELNITDAMGERGLEFTLQTFQDFDGVMTAFNDNQCDAVTTDQSGLVSRRAQQVDPGAYTILPFVISKEPLGPVSPQSDPQFGDVMTWTVFGLIQAEEFGINSENIGDFLPMDGEDAEAYTERVGADIARFLGQGENLAGDYLGIPNDFMVTVITQVGNYGEIFDRHLAPLGLERGVNALWTDGGLLYSPPFR